MKSTDKLYRNRLLIEKYSLKNDMEETFLMLIDDIEIKINKKKHPDSLFFFRGRKCLFKQELNNDLFLFSFYNVYFVFSCMYVYGKNFDSANEIFGKVSLFLKKMIEKHFKIKNPKVRFHYGSCIARFKTFQNQ